MSDYNDKADNIRERENFKGGSIITKMQDDGTGNEYGPYKYLVSPPSEGRNWYYLGRASGSSNSDSSESVGKAETSDDLDDVIKNREELNKFIEDKKEKGDISEELDFDEVLNYYKTEMDVKEFEYSDYRIYVKTEYEWIDDWKIKVTEKEFDYDTMLVNYVDYDNGKSDRIRRPFISDEIGEWSDVDEVDVFRDEY